MKNELFRKLPKVDILMKNNLLKDLMLQMDYNSFYEVVTLGIDYFRNKIKNGEIEKFSEDQVIAKIRILAKKYQERNLKNVINGTGVILHTNLGRAILNDQVADKLKKIVTGYSNLEFNLKTGERGSRYQLLEELICKVTGAEGAMIVNNNASAVILCLNEFAKNKKTVVSRGELVEIGGSFRIPEIMELSGTILREVGTTNKTNINDYEKAIETALEEEDKNNKIGVLLKVHTSNYKIIGFTDSVNKCEIATLGKKYNIITIDDIGSGVLIDYTKYGLTKEPTVQESLKAGMDIVTFSGDKMLGGAQCGIIVGKKELIERLKKNPFTRAFRVDKMSIAVMEEIFRYYLNEEKAIKEIPVLEMLTENSEKVNLRAEKLRDLLTSKGIKARVVKTVALVGGGAMPDEKIISYGIALKNDNNLESKFRECDTPIIGRTKDNNFILDLKTIKEKDFQYIVEEAEKIIL